MKRVIFFGVVCYGLTFFTEVFAQGSRILAPNYGDTTSIGTPGPANNDFAWLEHDAFGGAVDNFLDPDAPQDERLFVYLRAGETLRYGIRRIPVKLQAGQTYVNSTVEATNQDLTMMLVATDLASVSNDTIVQATHFDANTSWNGDAQLTNSNGAGVDGIIQNPAEALLGPEFLFNGITYNSGGYEPLEFTNTTGVDQAFWIGLLQDNYAFTDESTLISDIETNTINDVDVRSWYDLWDFTVYNDNEEKQGRLYCRRWNFTAQNFGNRLADEFQMYIRVPSVISGADAGNYIKELDIGGLDPFSAIIYANSEGSDGTDGDTNGDGTTDFQDFRQSQLTDIGFTEYDIFIQNPDIDLWPTSTLPSVSITNAVFYCNDAGTGGEAAIGFETNQVGYAAILIDLNGIGGHQVNTTDVIIEVEITTIGSQTLRWDGLDGNGDPVASGTPITISGRFTSGPIHVPMFDVEESAVGINMLDVRPSTSFDLIYWDDLYLEDQGEDTGADPLAELDGTNASTHLWDNNGGNNGGNEVLVNTWSFGYYQINTENRFFSYTCDEDGDGVSGAIDLDSDNDGVANSVEGDHRADDDGDDIPNYLDADFAGFTDSNNDGVDDNFDADLDGVPNSLDVDSDNDGIPDLVENGLADTNLDGQLDGTITDLNGNGLEDLYDPACDGSGAPVTGSGVATINSGATDPDNAVDGNLATGADLRNGDFLIIDLTGGGTIPAGATITITAMEGNVGSANDLLRVAETNNTDGTGLTDVYASYQLTAGEFNPETVPPFVLSQAVRYIYVSQAANGENPYVNNISYSYTGAAVCTGGAALTLINTDGDGVDNYLDIDSDNDGIVDVIEAGGDADTSTGQIAGFTDTNGNGLNDLQESIALTVPNTDGDTDSGGDPIYDYLDIDSDNDGILDNVDGQDSENTIATTAGDTNANGLLDVYDPTNGGALIVPVDTDADGTDDYQSADADGDGVLDFIEGWDADLDGFSDLDSDEDGDISDETGHNLDADGDGLWDIFEGATAPVPNTDGSGKSNWQDTDDDNDGILTIGEDTGDGMGGGPDGDWSNDRTQGQGASADTPDYLYRGDYDGDAVPDATDLDSDNDGVLDADESNGEAVDPSVDGDNNGIPNYQDLADVAVSGALTSSADANGDGVYDVFDTDFDGIPDFLDLDSDNDGIWDAVEANSGTVPNGLSTTTGQFTLQDPDNDGLMNYIDTDDVTMAGVSNLSNPDTDSDGIKDYLDIDSDGDGIVDIIEAQTSSAFIGLTNSDTDGDGIDDAFDPTDGGVRLDPINTDGLDLRDYLDLDSDNDDIADIIEGDDVDQDGYGDWDANESNTADEATYGDDTDGDGLSDLFDTVTLGTIGNEVGSNADLPNTDGIDEKNWRDSDDDNDGILSINEDANNDDNYANDQTGGQGGDVPDFLFYIDFDNDNITDASDADSDNDGILDTIEDGGTGIDPSGDIDGDGILNAYDDDIDGDMTPNESDSDADGIGGPDAEQLTDTNGDGIADQFDQDLDGIPDYRDRDSDNDGVPDIVEAGGEDTDSDGIVDGLTDDDQDGIPDSVDVDNSGSNGGSGDDIDGDGIDDTFDASQTAGTDTDGDDILDTFDPDIDGDGLANTYDPDNGGTLLSPPDADGDGLSDYLDLDSDNDGITDLKEAGGTDADGDGKLDDATDSDQDGFGDLIDADNGGTALPRPDSDNDGVRDYLDVDSDNDGVPDTVDNGGPDTNNDGLVDGFNSDADGDGLADVVDPDSGGTPISNVDTDGDGFDDYLDLDADNDGYPDILEAGGTDADNDGIVDNQLNSDADTDMDTVPDNVDVDQTGGTDSDNDEIDDAFDVDFTGGNDDDGDGIDNAFDLDKDGNGFDDFAEANPYGQEDKEGDGLKDFRDLDSDGDGIVDVIEFGGTVDAATGRIDGFVDNVTPNGWYEISEGRPALDIPDSDADGFEDYRDIDADNDGLPDNIEAHTKASYIAISEIDTDNDGLDDAYDPDNGGTLPPLPATDGGDADYLDDDSDADEVPDNIEGDNDDKSQYADWDTDNDNDVTDETGYSADTDSDGLLDVFDIVASNGSANVTGSNSDGQDSDNDGIWDFQDVDDDGDGLTTASEEGQSNDGDPTNDFNDGGTPIPDYLFGNPDKDSDGINDDIDLDSDNDGLADTEEDGGTGIDPSGDEDSDGILNAFDNDLDGDGIPNEADTDADNSGSTDTIRLTDSNNDGIPDEFDKDKDGVPDFVDIDADNDGLADVVEFGLADTDEDGTLAEAGVITDTNGNGLDDAYDPACDGSGGTVNGNGVAVINSGATNPDNAANGNLANGADLRNGDFIIIDLTGSATTIPAGATITVTGMEGDAGGDNDLLTLSETNATNGTGLVNTQPNFSFTNGNFVQQTVTPWNLSADTRYIYAAQGAGGNNPYVNNVAYSYSDPTCTGGVAITLPDTDSDGVPDHQDLDSDNDGIPDNVEAQTAVDYTAPAAGDADGDGLLDVYDEDIAVGNAIDPTNTDGPADTVPDYLDDDSDEDGVADVIEAFDSNTDGFGSWDTDSDNVVSTETGFDVDVDEDGIVEIFDSNSGLGTIANITGTSAERQDTDGDGIEDWRDINDDGDANNTEDEDANTNGNFADDFTQGGNTIPDYLFNDDSDDDGISDAVDLDSDNDGVLNTDEYNGATYNSGGNPFDDDDMDGIYNYLDSSDPNHEDVNNDGVDDRVDQDRDGIPNFFDLDADNDGILDAIEANNGLIPTGFNTSTGRYGVDNSGGDDDDDNNDGLNDNVDESGSGIELVKEDFDSDGIDDYLDLDSDNDGLTDHLEGLTTAAYQAPSGNDSDSDGLDDLFDGNNGGTVVIPTNSESEGEPDYRDIDSDNDNDGDGVLQDIIEGYDANRNGFSDLDLDLDGELSDETGWNVDTDGDGIWNIFDSFAGRGTTNVIGTYADLQDTDSDGILDFRDTDDDNDALTTATEDVDNNGNWTDDKVQGGGATPDYLFFNDTDMDGIADGVDIDGDNDGIANSEEYNSGTDPDPFGDIDNDGVFNYNDNNDPALSGLTDSNGDGIYDEYDRDLDGLPNFFDLDSDNDGIPDMVEANNGVLPDPSGTANDPNDQGQFPAVATTGDANGLFDDFDDSAGGTAIENPDTDGDGLNDVLDIDSDNDGIVDLVEAGGSDFDGSGTIDGFGDTDGDGLANSVDTDDSGAALPIPNTDGIGGPNYIDTNSDEDSLLDFDEGFDDDEDGDATSPGEDYEARATAYGDAGKYDPTNLSWLSDFLTFGSPNYYDTDGDGLVDLFDPDNGGNWYGNVSGVPDNDFNGIANVLDDDGGSPPLPLTWLSFDGWFENYQVELEWKTADEDNVSHFDIEWSPDGATFSVIGQLAAANTYETINTYDYTDKRFIEGFNYYRLNQVDFDGQSEYSETIVVLASDSPFKVNIYPNPATDYIRVEGSVPLPLGEYSMFDMSGRQIIRGNTRNVNRLDIDVRHLIPGIYQLIVNTEIGIYKLKLIKQ